MGIQRLNQSQLDEIQTRMQFDPNILAYLSIDRYFGRWTVDDSDWNTIAFGIDLCSFIHITIDRGRDLEMSISLYSTNPIHAGRLMLYLRDHLIPRYKPKAINTTAHSSNIKSIMINRKILGPEYAIKKAYAWNMGTGKYDDLYMFRKIMEYEHI